MSQALKRYRAGLVVSCALVTMGPAVGILSSMFEIGSMLAETASSDASPSEKSRLMGPAVARAVRAPMYGIALALVAALPAAYFAARLHNERLRQRAPLQ